jgi:hypothetical protein
MNRSSILLTQLMDAYSVLDYTLTQLEIQKLAYSLQESGEPLRLEYEAGHYSPTQRIGTRSRKLWRAIPPRLRRQAGPQLGNRTLARRSRRIDPLPGEEKRSGTNNGQPIDYVRLTTRALQRLRMDRRRPRTVGRQTRHSRHPPFSGTDP